MCLVVGFWIANAAVSLLNNKFNRSKYNKLTNNVAKMSDDKNERYIYRNIYNEQIVVTSDDDDDDDNNTQIH